MLPSLSSMITNTIDSGGICTMTSSISGGLLLSLRQSWHFQTVNFFTTKTVTKKKYKGNGIRPAAKRPVEIHPKLLRKDWYYGSHKVALGLQERLDGRSFQRLRSLLEKLPLTFDWHQQQWTMDLESANMACKEGGVSKLRDALLQHHFILGPFPLLMEGDDNGDEQNLVASVERISLGLSEDQVAVLQPDDTDNKGFFIFCPPVKRGDGCPLHDIIQNHLTGVTEEVEEALIPGSTMTAHAYLTYDVWLVAELIEVMKERLPTSSLLLDDKTDASLKSRHQDKSERRKPIPELSARNAQTDLYPHQIEAVRYLQDCNGCGILSSEMGLGKTMATLAYLLIEQQRAVVVCPKNVREHWQQDATVLSSEYFGGDHTILLGADWEHKNDAETTAALLADARLICINYESLPKYLPLILETKPAIDCLVLDESHFAKNRKAQRTQNLLLAKDFFQSRILLSGTPIKNRVKELSTQLEMIGYPVNEDEMVGMSPGAIWNLLHKEGIYLKQTMKEEMPHLKFEEPLITVEELDSDISSEIDTWAEEDLLAQLEAKLKRTALQKVSKSTELAVQLTKDNPADKVIIFTERIAVAEAIRDDIVEFHRGTALLHNGGFSAKERDQILADFRDPESPYNILVSTRHSLSVGVNLQCANVVIFNDLPWTPTDIQQAAARVRRLNQKKEVVEYWVKTNTDFDTSLIGTLMRKYSLIKQYAEGKNLPDKELKWMHRRVSIYDDLGIPRPKTKTTTQKKKKDSTDTLQADV